MLRYAILLLLAHSAVSAPASSGVGTALARCGLLDNGDVNVNTLNLLEVVYDLGNQPDATSQALAISQYLAIVGALSSGEPGNACVPANVINVFASGNVQGAVRSYSDHLGNIIGAVSNLAANPLSARFSSGAAGSCANGGRLFGFEGPWDALLSTTSPNSYSLVNEAYCAIGRLHRAHSVDSSNVAAYVTAASLPPVVSVFEAALPHAISFVNALNSGNDVSAAATTLQKELSKKCFNE